MIRRACAGGVLIALVAATDAHAQIGDTVFRPHFRWGVEGGATGTAGILSGGVLLGGVVGARVSEHFGVVVPLAVDFGGMAGGVGGTPAIGLRGGVGVEWVPYDALSPIPTVLLRLSALGGTYLCTDAGDQQTIPWCERFVTGASLHAGWLFLGGITTEAGAAGELGLEVGFLGAPETAVWGPSFSLVFAWNIF